MFVSFYRFQLDTGGEKPPRRHSFTHILSVNPEAQITDVTLSDYV